MKLFNDSTMGGHSGVLHTYRRIKGHFYWKVMQKQIEEMVHGCGICAQNKGDNQASPYPKTNLGEH